MGSRGCIILICNSFLLFLYILVSLNRFFEILFNFFFWFLFFFFWERGLICHGGGHLFHGLSISILLTIFFIFVYHFFKHSLKRLWIFIFFFSFLIFLGFLFIFIIRFFFVIILYLLFFTFIFFFTFISFFIFLIFFHDFIHFIGIRVFGLNSGVILRRCIVRSLLKELFSGSFQSGTRGIDFFFGSLLLVLLFFDFEFVLHLIGLKLHIPIITWCFAQNMVSGLLLFDTLPQVITCSP